MKAILSTLTALALLSSTVAMAGDSPAPKAKVEKKVVVVQDGEGDEPFVWVSDDGDDREMVIHGLPGGGAFLGVQLLDPTPELLEVWKVNDDHGVLVSKLVDDSPAGKAGIRVGDVITRVDAEDVHGSFDLSAKIGRHKPGERVDIDVVRAGRNEKIKVELGERKGGDMARKHRIKIMGGPDDSDVRDIEKRIEMAFGDNVGTVDIVGPDSLRTAALEKRIKELEAKLERLAKELDKLD